MVKNNAGGYGFAVDDWVRLERFLIMGTEGGTFYVGEKKLTQDNCEAALRCIGVDGRRVVDMILQISEGGRAKNNDQALFILAMCAKKGDLATRQYANNVLHRVARIGTHLFHYANFIKAFGGFGSGQVRSIGNWYAKKEASKLAYQVTKYQQRDSWSHTDLLRLSHQKPPSADHQAIFQWIIKGREKDLPPVTDVPEALHVIWAMERAKELAPAEGSKPTQKNISDMVKLILDYRMAHETVPNTFKKTPDIWAALLQHMPPGALVRNMGRLGSLGLLTNLSDSMQVVRSTLLDDGKLRKARLHPLAVLVALTVYSGGRGIMGDLTWETCGAATDALDECFYKSFGFVEPTNKRLLLSVDISASMTWHNISKHVPLTPRQASAAMAMVTARVEPTYEVCVFSDTLRTVDLSPCQRLDDVSKTISGMRAGGTNCALPMQMALQKKVMVDSFVIYSDNETWAGRQHVVQALQEYRNKVNPNAKFIAVSMLPVHHTIVDPKDAGMLDVIGFDTATPSLISAFITE